MTNQDARVAEAVGYEAWETKKNWLGQYKLGALYRVLRGRGSPIERSVESLKEDGYRQVPYVSWLEVEGLENHLKPPPFISAPTANTDQIVLEWVQGQEYWTGFGSFLGALKDIIYSAYNEWAIEKHDMAVDGWPNKKMRDKAANWLVIYLKYYKPGMYAQALLAIQEERDA